MLSQTTAPPPPNETITNLPTTEQSHSTIPFIDTKEVPVTWENLNLTGRLIYINSNSNSDNFSPSIQILDLESGEVGTVFRAGDGTWIFYLDVSPDGKQIVISYIDPTQAKASSNRALYLLPLDGTLQPKLLFTPPSSDDHYTQAEWSPDGKYIYYSHYNSNKDLIAPLTPDYEIYRMSYPDGHSEKIVDHAFWPRISSDSRKLVYVAINKDTQKSELYVANADGSDPKQVVFSENFDTDILDAPIFTPDGQSILFSVPSPGTVYKPNLLDILTGVQVAKAHSVPSDWWSVPVTGGDPMRLTQLETVNLFASVLSDQKHIVSISADGLFAMEFDGSGITRLLSEPEIYGSVRWMP